MFTQSSNPMPLILLFTAIGFIVGAAIVYFSTRGGSGAVKKELEQLRQKDKLWREVIGFSREKATHKLVVWLGSKPFPSPKQLTDAQRQELAANGRDFLAWLASEQAPAAPAAAPQPPAPVQQALVTPPPAAPVQAAPPAAQPLASSQPVAQPIRPQVPLPSAEPVQAAPMAAQPFAQPVRPVVTPPPASAAPVIPVAQPPATSPTPEEVVAIAGKTGPLPPLAEDKKVEKPKSIVEQINDILQENIRGTALEGKAVRLMEDPRKGVVVWVGLVPYAGVDAVTDPEIKEALRSAASEWERRMERNRR